MSVLSTGQLTLTQWSMLLLAFIIIMLCVTMVITLILYQYIDIKNNSLLWVRVQKQYIKQYLSVQTVVEETIIFKYFHFTGQMFLYLSPFTSNLFHKANMKVLNQICFWMHSKEMPSNMTLNLWMNFCSIHAEQTKFLSNRMCGIISKASKCRQKWLKYHPNESLINDCVTTIG